MYGKFPNNASEADKTALLDALEKMISTVVAVAPEGCEITIDSLSNKRAYRMSIPSISIRRTLKYLKRYVDRP